MKTISLANTSKNWYYNLNEHDSSVNGSILTGKCTIRGICREDAEPGDVFSVPGSKEWINYTIESILKEDSKGKFNNPDDAINALFVAECSFSRSIN